MSKEVDKDLERIFKAYYSMLYKISVILLCNEQDAYDAVQDTFIKYLEYKKMFLDKEYEKAWLLRVNINICKNMLRFRKMHPMVDYTKTVLPYLDEKDYEVMSVLSKLSRKAKEVIILRFIVGYTNKEIAILLKCSENAVKKRLERAKAEFKKEYDKE